MRIELIHPMLVHFPIALLFTGLIVRFIALWVRKKSSLSFLLPASWMILGLGVLAAWVAIVAGELARDVVEPTLENLTILDEHSHHAYYTAYGFTMGLCLDLIRAYLMRTSKKKVWLVRRGLAAFIWFFYLISLGNLLITGYLGGSLVYSEAAAVKKLNS